MNQSRAFLPIFLRSHPCRLSVCRFGVVAVMACFLVSGLPARLPAAQKKSPGWKAGAAAVVITPDKPMWMAGYASRTKPSEGKIHDLYAKALAVEGPHGSRLVMVTLDLISVPRPLRDGLEHAVKQKFALPAAGLLVNCSHTHSGPELRTTPSALRGLTTARERQAETYARKLQAKLVRLVGEALHDLGPARLGYSHARCGFAMNRRTPSPTGFRNFPNPDGPVDHDVPVLRVIRPDGTLRAVVFGYACHNTTLGFYKFCGDYAGFAQYDLEAAHPGTTALFVQGCGGDQNPYPRRTVELARQHGRSLANAVEAALLTHPRPISGTLRSAIGLATVEYQTPPTRAELLRRKQSKNKYDRRYAERLLRQLKERGKLRDRYRCPVQVVRFGDALTLVALPGETVVDYSLRLKRELTGGRGTRPAVWVAGYSNDVFAYLPSRRVLQEGGYEGGGAMKYFATVVQPGPFAASVEERIVSKVHELLQQLGQ